MLDIRKVYTAIEETRIEGGKKVENPIKMIITMAVIKNPWAGRGYVDNLKPEIDEYAPQIGELLVAELFKHIDSADDVEAFGKAAVVGVDGEVEHASAFIHTLKFGNKFRDAVKGTSILSFTNKRGGAGTAVLIPMVHKTDDSERSHFITFEASIPDAPRADEIVVAIGVSTGGRPHPRTGNRHQDMVEMGLV
ncbi:amino acid synthesis family protein [Bacillus sp. ISL-4]|uniref:amino acid synthesis family protein n=1 Tax=Bacillaceae TaxID=186817 RepID=UPI0017812CA1|nr:MULTISPECIES: amino acid synthesis family protein [Bacillales]MBT2664767.1 amino acid synthesis family protein [Bacillus sp. ISL-4]MBT2671477.1 amino acid synthesis family protein [Streptomyces sp. ISL-14]QOS92228.1 amino acid synthesis family protein [Brevibacillus sp. JNUCC-41]